jgi:hypothetical protein
MREIQLYGKKAAGRVAFVDDGDLDLVSQYRWHCYGGKDRPELRTRGPYARTKPPARSRSTDGPTFILMHVLIMGLTGVDHVDHDGLNNQRYNLRPATVAQNNHNQRPRITGSSRYKGVTWHKKCKKWQATIKLNNRCVYLGLFAGEEEAAVAYDTAALAAYGERAYLNGVAA